MVAVLGLFACTPSTNAPSADLDAQFSPIGAERTTASTSVTSSTQETSPSPVVANGKILAISIANSLTVANEYPSGYDRDYFNHWVTVDAAGCNAREHVLKAESVRFPQVDYPCYVVAGDWYSAYDGVTISDRAEVDIDHMVPLKEAWDSGAWRWSSQTREQYANDIGDGRSLIAVSGSSNRSKSDNDPSQWMPAVRSYQCKYLGHWVAVKARWGLSMDPSEAGYVKKQLNSTCKGLRIAKVVKASVTFGPPPSATTTTPAPSGGYVTTGVGAGQFCKTEHRGLFGLASNGRVVQCLDSGSGWRWKYV